MGLSITRGLIPLRPSGRGRSGSRVFRALLVTLFSLCGLGVQPLSASQPDYILVERLAPRSTYEIISPLSFSFEEEGHEPPRFEFFKKTVEILPPFWRDTKLHVLLFL
jgi:hypothetical protein